MSVYQVDQCMNSRRFVEACKREGLVDIRRFPTGLIDRKDPEVLRAILASGHVLVTTDRRIHTEHAESLPGQHAGILIVAAVAQAATLTTAGVMRILRHFKSSFPDWHQASLQNLAVEITEVGVQVSRANAGAVRRVGYVGYDQPLWQSELMSLISQGDISKGT